MPQDANKKRSTNNQNLIHQRTDDPCPDLVVERGPDDEGVGSWVPAEKHRLLCEYLYVTRNAWKGWPKRAYIDPFAGPGRIKVRGEAFTRDGGAVLAWRSLAEAAPFTRMFVGDLNPTRAAACEARLRSLGAPATSYAGEATHTVKEMVSAVPAGSLSMAFLDPYNLELLSFSIIQALAKLRKLDLLINFSTMDLQRNGDLEFDPKRKRFDETAPGWRQSKDVLEASKQNLPLAFFKYWCGLVKGLGFEHSEEMPLINNDSGRSIYRLVFFARHDLPKRIWTDVAKGRNRSFEF